jgi:hypothetical protein
MQILDPTLIGLGTRDRGDDLRRSCQWWNQNADRLAAIPVYGEAVWGGSDGNSRSRKVCLLPRGNHHCGLRHTVGWRPSQSVTVIVAFVSFVNRKTGLGAMLGAEDTSHAALTVPASQMDTSAPHTARPDMS